MKRAGRLMAAAALASLAFWCGLRIGAGMIPAAVPSPVPTPGAEVEDWEDLNADQLSWVIEGIHEHISDLEDELRYARKLQAEKMRTE